MATNSKMSTKDTFINMPPPRPKPGPWLSQNKMNEFNELIDIFFNHRKASKPVVETKDKPAVTIYELIRRKSSLVLVEGVLYKVTCEPVDVEKIK